MIFVDRNLVKEPETLSKKEGKGKKETVKAIDFYGNPANANNKFNFQAYKENDIRDTLNDLFNGKCGYCEAKIVVVTVGDIEHFRPKGGYGENPKNLTKPGYYWLATKWDNLLLSCPNCNRTNTFEIVNIGKMTVGKLNQFPLRNESFRLRNPNDNFQAEEEVRCLLDPCKDNPENHLKFSDDGIILPAKKGRGFSVKGTHSIKVYALQRKNLVEERAALAIKIKAQIKSVDTAIRIQDAIGIGINGDVDQSLQDEIEKLKAYLNPKEPFLALARQLIQPFIDKIIR